MFMADSRKDGAGGEAARLFGVGFTFAAITAAPTVGGYFLDRLFGTIPLFLLVGLVVGFVGGLLYVYRVLKKMGDG